MIKKIILFATIFLIVVPFSFSQSDKVIGIWLSEEKDGKVEIFKKDGKYYGKLVWIDSANYVNGQPKKDVNNPNPKYRTRSVLNIELLKNFSYDSDDKEWTDGEIYDPKNGSTYSCYMWFEDNDYSKLNIRGYIGLSIIGRTTVWTRSKL